MVEVRFKKHLLRLSFKKTQLTEDNLKTHTFITWNTKLFSHATAIFNYSLSLQTHRDEAGEKHAHSIFHFDLHVCDLIPCCLLYFVGFACVSWVVLYSGCLCGLVCFQFYSESLIFRVFYFPHVSSLCEDFFHPYFVILSNCIKSNASFCLCQFVSLLS